MVWNGVQYRLHVEDIRLDVHTICDDETLVSTPFAYAFPSPSIQSMMSLAI